MPYMLISAGLFKFKHADAVLQLWILDARNLPIRMPDQPLASCTGCDIT